jgi:hypothetical protein
VKELLSISLLVWFSLTGFSQQLTKRFAERYKLDLPRIWMKPKIIKAVTEVLPLTLDELKDKDFCTDCEGVYTVQLLVDSPYIKSRNNISNGYSGNVLNYTMEIIYQFRSTLGLFDTSGNLLTELILVAPDEEHVKKSAMQMNQMTYSRQIITDREGRVTQIMVPVYRSAPVTNDLYPSLEDLSAITEQRLYQVRDILKKIK